VTTSRIIELPLNGRQSRLIVIFGAATPDANGEHDQQQDYPSSTTMSVAGGQGNGTNYLLDAATTFPISRS